AGRVVVAHQPGQHPEEAVGGVDRRPVGRAHRVGGGEEGPVEKAGGVDEEGEVAGGGGHGHPALVMAARARSRSASSTSLWVTRRTVVWSTVPARTPAAARSSRNDGGRAEASAQTMLVRTLTGSTEPGKRSA